MHRAGECDNANVLKWKSIDGGPSLAVLAFYVLLFFGSPTMMHQ